MNRGSSFMIRKWAPLRASHQRDVLLSLGVTRQLRFSSTLGASTTNTSHQTKPTPHTSPPARPLDANEVVSMLQESPEVTREVIMRLSPAKRRQLLVAASYYEWFGEEITAGQTSHDVRTSGSCRGSYVEERNYAASMNAKAASAEVPSTNAAGSSNVGTASSTPASSATSPSASPRAPAETPARHSSFCTSPTGVITDSNAAASFSWEELRRRRRERILQEEEHRIRKEMQEAHPIPSLPMTRKEYDEWIRSTIQSMKSSASVGGSGSTIPFRVLAKVALQTGLPFMAFGTLDNSMLILAGDMLDNWIGADLKLSPMGAAALGGIVSGVVGIQIHGLAERAVTKYGPPPPALKPSQWRSPRVQSAIHWGGTFGLVCGLFCGMFPLLLISDSTSVRRALENDDGEAPRALVEPK